MNTPAQYQHLWDTMVIEINASRVNNIAIKIGSNLARYQTVVSGWSIPAYVVGVIHNMESDLNFTRHLHNGDKLTARTVHVPAGRPLTGTPPFTWEESAKDALQMRGMDKVTDWSISHMLLVVEGYNGFGYARRGRLSPYLWAGSNHYTKGKYVSDGKFDPEAVSNQIGAALILKQFV
jgi:lysozyme family protein